MKKKIATIMKKKTNDPLHIGKEINFGNLDNVSTVSLKSTSSMMTETYLTNLNKKNIIFQKYV